MIMFHGNRTCVEEHQDNHEPEPGRGLNKTTLIKLIKPKHLLRLSWQRKHTARISNKRITTWKMFQNSMKENPAICGFVLEVSHKKIEC